MSALEKPAKEIMSADLETLKKPFTRGKLLSAIAVIPANDDNNAPLHIYAGPQGCSPS